MGLIETTTASCGLAALLVGRAGTPAVADGEREDRWRDHDEHESGWSEG